MDLFGHCVAFRPALVVWGSSLGLLDVAMSGPGTHLEVRRDLPSENSCELCVGADDLGTAVLGTVDIL